MQLYRPTRKDGTVASPFWWYDTVYKGRRYRKSTGIRDKATAKKYADQLEAELRLGRPLDGPAEVERPTFKAYADAYLEGDAAVKRSSRSIRSILNRVLIPTFGTFRLNEITREAVEAFRNDRLAGKLAGRVEKPSRRTVQYELAVLHRVLNLAVDAGLLDRNPAARVKVGTLNNRRERVISEDEYRRILRAVDEDHGAHLVPIVTLGWETGMRESEILGLKWADVDFERHVARLPRTKNGEARSVPLSEEAERVLRAPVWWRRDGTYVFPSRTGKGHLGLVSHAFAGLCERGNVEAAKFHDLRHTFCTRMVAAGVDLITLASITGHKSMDMLRRYTHPSDSAKVEAVRSTSHPRHTEPAERSEAAATR